MARYQREAEKDTVLCPTCRGQGRVLGPEAPSEEQLEAGLETVEEGGTSFDPGEHNVEEVEAFLVEHPDDAQAVLDAERAGKDRKGVIEAAQALIDASSEDTGEDQGDESTDEAPADGGPEGEF